MKEYRFQDGKWIIIDTATEPEPLEYLDDDQENTDAKWEAFFKWTRQCLNDDTVFKKALERCHADKSAIAVEPAVTSAKESKNLNAIKKS